MNKRRESAVPKRRIGDQIIHNSHFRLGVGRLVPKAILHIDEHVEKTSQQRAIFLCANRLQKAAEARHPAVEDNPRDNRQDHSAIHHRLLLLLHRGGAALCGGGRGASARGRRRGLIRAGREVLPVLAHEHDKTVH